MKPQRGWTYLIAGLLFCSFMGGAFRVAFSPAVMENWVQTVVAEKQPKFNIDFSKVNFSLSRGWRPHLAVEFENLQIGAKDPCITPDELFIDRLTIPFQVRDLIEKNLKFGRTHAEKIIYYDKKFKCEEEDEEERLSSSSSNGPREDEAEGVARDIAPLENFLQKRWDVEIVNTSHFFSSLHIDELVLIKDGEPSPRFGLRNAEVRFFPGRRASQVTFQFFPGEKWSASESFGPIRTTLDVSSDLIHLKASGSVREGQFRIDTQWSVDRRRFHGDVSWRDMPVAAVSRLTSYWSGLDLLKGFSFQPRHTWMNCEVSVGGEVTEIKDLPVKIRNCAMAGDLGKVLLADVDFRKEETPLVFKLESVSLDVLLKGLGYKDFPSYIVNWGIVDGELSVEALERAGFTGEITRLSSTSFMGRTRQRSLLDFNLNANLSDKFIEVDLGPLDFTYKTILFKDLLLNFKSSMPLRERFPLKAQAHAVEVTDRYEHFSTLANILKPKEENTKSITLSPFKGSGELVGEVIWWEKMNFSAMEKDIQLSGLDGGAFSDLPILVSMKPSNEKISSRAERYEVRREGKNILLLKTQ